MILYGVGNRTILGDMEIPFSIFLKAGVFLWLGSLPLYLEHLFLNLCFSKTVSIAVSIGQLLISALFLTGLGQGNGSISPVPGVPGELLCILRKNLIEEWLWELPIQI